MWSVLLVSTALALTPEEAGIITQIEAQRLPPLALAEYVNADTPATRARASRALGRLRTASALAPLKRLVEDPSVEVRREAAHALGQTPGSLRVTRSRLLEERDPEVRRRLIAALGHQGDKSSITVLLNELHTANASLGVPAHQIAAAHAIARLAMRDVPAAQTPEVTAQLLIGLNRRDVALQRAVAFALARQVGRDLTTPQQEALAHAALHAPDDTVRSLLVRALAEANAAPSEVLNELADDASARVRVAVARAASRCAWEGVTTLVSDPDPAVRSEAIGALGTLKTDDSASQLASIIDAGATLEAAEAWRHSRDPRLHEAAAALHALGASGQLADPLRWLHTDQPTVIRVAATSYVEDVNTLVETAMNDGEGAVRTSAATALIDRTSRAGTLRELLVAHDPMVAAIAASALETRLHRNNLTPLLSAIAKGDDPDLLSASLRAVAALLETGTVRNFPQTAIEAARDNRAHPSAHVRASAQRLLKATGNEEGNDWHHTVGAPSPEVSTARSARVFTTAGEFIVELYPDEAPLTVQNFAALAEDGFFDQSLWHRVVPDFVVQTGDPRGDGHGGPGYTIPDEINPIEYREGTLGMALAGADTGGSQWFITLSPQPHLDGRYTAFGRVVRGQHILQQLQQGDRILSLQIERTTHPDEP